MFALIYLFPFGLLIIVLIQKWYEDRKFQMNIFKRMNVPYVPPNTIFGNYKELKKSRCKFNQVYQWVQEYGTVFGFHFGLKAVLVVSDIDMVWDILVKKFDSFRNRPDLVIAVEPVVNTLVGLKNERWKYVRSILAPTYSMAKMKVLVNTFNDKALEMINVMEEKQLKHKSVNSLRTYQGLTLDVISETALAMKSDCQRNPNNTMYILVTSFLKNAMNFAVILALHFPFWGRVLSFVCNQLSYSGRATQLIVNHLKYVIKFRRNNPSMKFVDLLQMMLDASVSENRSQKLKPMTDPEIIANAWVFLLGGFETTSSCLTFTTYLLAKHPDVQEKLYQEIESSIPESDLTVSYSQIKSLKYLDCVVHESLRLYPPVVDFIVRQAERDVEVGGIKIPKGMNISIPVWAIHKNPDIWEQPDEFIPERFEKDKQRHPMAYLPFGAGPRNCPGSRFGLMETKVGLVQLLRNFRIRLAPNAEDPPTLNQYTVSIQPADGTPVVLSSRK